MQVNSAQDYLTMKKRQLIAKSYYTTPPPQNKKYNSVYTSVEGNNATQFQRVIVPAKFGVSANVTAASFTNWCCGTSPNVGGVFSLVNTKNIQRIQDLNLPMSYRATV